MMPMSQAILMETFPPEEQAVAMSVWGLGAMIAPVGGPSYIEALNGPLAGVPFWVSGGVPMEDIGAYLRLGVKVVGLTASLFPPEALAQKDLERIRQNAQRAALAVAEAIGD